jgi:hypothetical protein
MPLFKVYRQDEPEPPPLEYVVVEAADEAEARGRAVEIPGEDWVEESERTRRPHWPEDGTVDEATESEFRTYRRLMAEAEGLRNHNQLDVRSAQECFQDEKH